MTRISENSAVPKPAKKRGRPSIADPQGLIGRVSEIFGDRTTDRTAQNRAYCTRAIEILGIKRKWKWLGIGSKEQINEYRAVRRTVLSELGRIRGPKFLKQCAAELCKQKLPSTRMAIGYVRKWRMGLSVPSDTMDLAVQLNTVAHAFHKDLRIPWWEVKRVLLIVHDQLPNDPPSDDSEDEAN